MNLKNQTAQAAEKEIFATDVLVIGAGTAGLSAAIYSLRSGHQVILLENNVHGGQILKTSTVENYPAIGQISGFDFANNLYRQAMDLGAKIYYHSLESANLGGKIKEVITSKGIFKAKTVIIANGAQHRKLGCEGEEEFTGRGVSYCATCDGAIYRGKNTAIIGGGNTALEDALFLANLCQKVYLVHRRAEFRGANILAESVQARENIEILYDSVVERIIGQDKVNAIEIKNLKDQSINTFPVEGVFIAVGLQPENGIFKDQVAVDGSGYIIAGEDCITDLPGVFVAGDTRTKILRQLVTAASDGAVSGTQASIYINKNF
ncbi:MAG: FAD-dependent oxidoreductase [Clostridiales bacterium]